VVIWDWANSKISGEGHDRSELDLPGNQEALLEAVVKTGVPVILVLQNGRALTIPWRRLMFRRFLKRGIPANLADAPSRKHFWRQQSGGRLPFHFRRASGNCRFSTITFPSKNNNYIDGNDSPQFVFGFGLSYTTFKYDHLTVTPPTAGSGDDIMFR